MTLRLMMLHNHTRFSHKLYYGSENIVSMNTNIVYPRCDLDLECSNPIFPEGTPANDAVLENKVWLQTDQQFRRYCTK